MLLSWSGDAPQSSLAPTSGYPHTHVDNAQAPGGYRVGHKNSRSGVGGATHALREEGAKCAVRNDRFALCSRGRPCENRHSLAHCAWARPCTQGSIASLEAPRTCIGPAMHSGSIASLGTPQAMSPVNAGGLSPCSIAPIRGTHEGTGKAIVHERREAIAILPR